MKRALVVDDDPGTCEGIAMVLELAGYAVSTALSQSEAIAALREVAPDAVVCDLGLGAGDGCAVARAARATPGLERARLIAYSGAESEAERARALAAGFDAFLLKPVEGAELLARLDAPAGS